MPRQLFPDPSSTVIEDRNGILLGASIAGDGQWRFPHNEHVPDYFRKAILQFEDRYFMYHPGVNIFSLTRSLITNIRAGKIVSGGSTLSMQVIRLSRKGKPRSVAGKVYEIILATRLEIRYSKSEILALYAANAPFGGNVVGLDAAAWRYFGRPPDQLSWAEVATLAVLPNAPSLIFPGKNQEVLLRKRDRLLDRLLVRGYIDQMTCDLAKIEPLPGKPMPLERSAPHLLDRAGKEHPGERVRTTLDYFLQKSVSDIVERHYHVLKFNEIHNAAALVVHVETGEVMAYIGNTPGEESRRQGNDVDIILAPRSSGSILKPLLYAALLDDGDILPNTLIPDIPMQYGGLIPSNFDRTFSGAVAAASALSRSLNVPAVGMLQTFGVSRFYDLLRKCGMTTLGKPPDHYGLSLILGGAEVTLWDLATMYSGMTRALKHYHYYSGMYVPNDWVQPEYVLQANEVHNKNSKTLSRMGTLSASAVWFTFEAMQEVNRPDDMTGWKSFSSALKIAWKTGTSFGLRDAWAVGVNPDYVVAVWVGNASGEGRSGLTGVTRAAPVMFDIFNILSESGWFTPPYDELAKIPVCRLSGHRANPYCEPVDSISVPLKGLKTTPCTYHHPLQLDKTGTFRVVSDCYDPLEMQTQSWFTLPPVMEWFYRRTNPLYKPLPGFLPDCSYLNADQPMEFIYPGRNNRLYLPLDMDGSPGSVVLEIAHRDPQSEVFWHLNNDFIGVTKHNHQVAVRPEYGSHVITVVDNDGNHLSKTIEIMQPR